MLTCETFAVGPFVSRCNCAVLADTLRREALVVDPGGEPALVAGVVQRLGLRVVAVVLTHAHVDHFVALGDVVAAHGGEVCVHPADRPLYDDWARQARRFAVTMRPLPPVTRPLADGDALAFGGFAALVLHTPGHTPGSVCLEVAGGERTLLLSGDTLFRRAVGTTDVKGGDPAALVRSVRRLYGRDPASRVIPGHGAETTLGDEARANPFVRA